MKITKIYHIICEDDFKTVPTDGSALVMWYEDLYVCCHDGYWRMVDIPPILDITVIDLKKQVPFVVDKGYRPIQGK